MPVLQNIRELRYGSGYSTAPNQTTATRKFRVQYDSSSYDLPQISVGDVINPANASTFSYFPVGIYQVYSTSYSRLRCSNLSSTPDPEMNDGRHYIVTADYIIYPSGFSNDADPWDQPPTVSIGKISYDIVAENAYNVLDANGFPTRPILTPAGEVYTNPPITRRKNNLVIRIHRFEENTFYNPLISADFIDTVNLFDIQIVGIIFPALTLRVKNIDATQQFQADTDEFYWSVTYELEADAGTHQKDVLNRGLYYIESGTLQRFKDENGKPTSTPRKLYLDGTPVPVGSSDATYTNYDLYYAQDFLPLELPAGILG